MVKEFCDICGREFTLDEILSRKFATLDIAVCFIPVVKDNVVRDQVCWDKKVCECCEEKLRDNYCNIIELIRSHQEEVK